MKHSIRDTKTGKFCRAPYDSAINHETVVVGAKYRHTGHQGVVYLGIEQRDPKRPRTLLIVKCEDDPSLENTTVVDADSEECYGAGFWRGFQQIV